MLAGGGGNDLLVGGPGADRLVLRRRSGHGKGRREGQDRQRLREGPRSPKGHDLDRGCKRFRRQLGQLDTLVRALTVRGEHEARVGAVRNGQRHRNAPSDYASSQATITFAPGQRSKSVAVSVVSDLAIEQDETFTVTLSNALNATIANGTATGTIRNDDTAVPVTVGTYKGLLDGNFIFFDVNSDRTVSGFRSNYIREDCNGNLYIYGTVSWGSTHRPIAADATFAFGGTSSGTVGGNPATFTNAVTGRLDGTNATGTYTASAEFDYQGTHYRCSSGTKPWTASLQP